MSFERIDAYKIKCDTCGEYLEGDGGPMFCETTDSIEAWADDFDNNWEIVSLGVHKCETCKWAEAEREEEERSGE